MQSQQDHESMSYMDTHCNPNLLLCLDGSWRPRIAGEAVFEAAADLAFQGSRLWVFRAQRSGFMGRDLNPRLWELEGSGFRVEGSRVRETFQAKGPGQRLPETFNCGVQV